MTSPILSVTNLVKVYGGATPCTVFTGLTFDVARGEILAVTGESGCGKTTLLNCIAGIDTVTSGEIIADGKPVHTMSEARLAAFRAATIGYVFQFHNLLLEFNALENVMIPALIRNYNRREAERKARALLARTGLSARAKHKIGELSGGEQQRVAIARALVLADEPTGNLDAKNAAQVADLLWAIVAESQRTLIVVTHSQDIARRAHRRMDLSAGR